jgi:parallel beta-helix repeat protein
MADAHKNFAYSTVATAPSPSTSGTSLVVAAGTGALFPTPPFNITIWPASVLPLASNAEIARVTAKTTDTFTIIRAQEGSSARSVSVGDQIAATITTKTLTDVEASIASLSLNVTQAPYNCVPDSTITTDHTAAFQTAINDAAAAGGGIVWVPPTASNLFFNIAGLELKSRVYLVGAGPHASRLCFYGTSANTMIRNHVSTNGTTDPNAEYCGVFDMMLYGNSGFTTGTVQASSSNHIGIKLTTNPLFAQGPDESADTQWRIRNLHITKFRDVAIQLEGRSSSVISDSYIQSIGIGGGQGIGIQVGFDTVVANCATGGTGTYGFQMDGPSNHFIGCKAFYAGDGGAGGAWDGFYIGSGAGSATLTGCIAQDNGGNGFQLAFCHGVTLTGCVADSNSRGTVGGYIGYWLHGCQECQLDGCVSQERTEDGVHSYQQHALALDSGAAYNRVSLTHGPQNGTVGDPIVTGSDAQFNSIQINGQGGYQDIAYASSITPDLYKGAVVSVGTLTGAMSVQNPLYNAWYGTRVTFSFIQDATGSRVVTFAGNQYKANGTLTAAANKRMSISFVCIGDGFALVETGRVTGF